MHLTLTAERSIAAAPEAVFALALDHERFPALFEGYGPIPGLKRITPLSPPALGSLRALENRDGSKLRERITALQPPHRHAYVLDGFRAPLSWLAREGQADWRFEAAADSGDAQAARTTRVVWTYVFELTSPLAWPLAAPLLQGCMRAAMRRCLDRMAQTLETAWREERR
ncbi:MAG: SRPBCC family protein [Lysobacter sp.]|nr:SRPBCC family protein [Lysobacter sp.]